MIKLFFITFLFAFFSPKQVNQSATNKNAIVQLSGTFEGYEPFWDLEIIKNKYTLKCDNVTLKGNLIISQKSVTDTTYAFKADNFYGIINRCATKNCEYALLDSAAFEIFFSFKGKTYKGCGNLK